MNSLFISLATFSIVDSEQKPNINYSKLSNYGKKIKKIKNKKKHEKREL